MASDLLTVRKSYNNDFSSYYFWLKEMEMLDWERADELESSHWAASDIETDDWNLITDGLVDVWRELLDATERCVRRSDYDVLMFLCHPPTGTLEAFPAKRDEFDTEENDRDVHVEVSLGAMAERLDDLEDAKEQEYDAEYMQAVSSLHGALVRSAGSADIAPRLATLGQDPGFAAYLSAEPDAEVDPQKFLVVAGSLPT